MNKLKILYISTACSKKKYKELFDLCNGKLHHSIQNFHSSIIEGLLENNTEVTALSGYQVSNENTKKRFFKLDQRARKRRNFYTPFV